ncbi:uncharacterized protein LOC116953949 [Petromyzon marinus]|uniref:uncharacterized protein LOC116953949 n=1 Tax=Petromyzon marinus TaxID=7757 RepID=UPI003F6EE770
MDASRATMSLRTLPLVLLLLLLGPVSPALCCLRCSPLFNNVRNQLKESIPGLSMDHKKEIYKVITEIGNMEAPILFDYEDVAPVFLKKILDIIDSMRPAVLLGGIRMAKNPEKSGPKTVDVPDVLSRLMGVEGEYEKKIEEITQAPCETCARESVPAMKCGSCERVVITCSSCVSIKKTLTNPDIMRIGGGIMLSCIFLLIIGILVTSYKKDEEKDPQDGMPTEVVSHKEELKPAVHCDKTKKKRSDKSGSIHHSQHKTPKAVTSYEKDGKDPQGGKLTEVLPHREDVKSVKTHSKKKKSSGHKDSGSKHHSKSKTDKK